MICIECLSQVTSACDTKKKCLESERTLRSLLEPKNSSEILEEHSEMSIIFEVVESIEQENQEQILVIQQRIQAENGSSLRRSSRQNPTEKPKFPKETNSPRILNVLSPTKLLERPAKKATSPEQFQLDTPKINQKVFNCDLCNFATNRKKNLERHILAVHLKSYNFSCSFDKCNRQYTTKAGLNLHFIRDHDESSPFECEKCNRKFSCASFLKHHLQGLSCRPRSKTTNKEKTEKSLACQHCSFRTAYQFSLKQHINLIHFNIRKPWKCEHCKDVEFSNRNSLNNHLFTVHNLLHIRCADCNQAFWSETELANHKTSLKCHARKATEDDYVETKSGVKCNLCERSYKTKKEWTTHYFNHHKFKKICDICNQQLSTYGALKNHKKTVHDKVKPFECTECPKKFSAKHSLQFHLNTHTGEKPFSCKWCSFKASDRSSVSKHQKKIHTDKS